MTQLEDKIGYVFKNEDLLREALTHRSYLNEHPEWDLPHNERLEFLGDAVLELAITEELYSRFPELPEGQLTVYRAAQAREVILANAMEALLGAIYLDGGFPPAAEFSRKLILTHLPEIIETRSYKDAKSELQELIQDRKRLTPTYRVLEESGPAHRREFRVGMFFGEELAAEGGGASKQEAELEAARNALQKMK